MINIHAEWENPVGYRTLQLGHRASARPQKVLYRREIVYVENRESMASTVRKL